MREITTEQISSAVRDLCIAANRKLPDSLCKAIDDSVTTEQGELAGEILRDLQRNIKAADELSLPICQDTGMAVVFAEVGQEVHITGGSFADAVNEGVHRGYVEGLLRCSVVSDPLERVNTGDNTPAILYTDLVEGDSIKLTVAPKGFGSENMSSLRMFTPAATEEDIIQYVTDVISTAGSNPCPPVVVGVGIGGDFELSALLAKKALCRDLSVKQPSPKYQKMEQEMLRRINALGIGPQGFGGNTTALAVHIETYPTHIAGLPVAVNVGCHVTRHASVTL